jgi:hypothetical protein
MEGQPWGTLLPLNDRQFFIDGRIGRSFDYTREGGKIVGLAYINHAKNICHPLRILNA